MKLTIEKINQIEGFLKIKDDWSRLLEISPQKSIFLTWDWLNIWWCHFSTRKKFHILIARDADKIVGIAPLMIVTVKRLGLKFKMLRSLGSPDIDITGFITEGENKEIVNALINAIKETSEDWDIFELGEFSNDIFDPFQIDNHFSKISFLSRIMIKNHIFIPTSGNWDIYYKSLPKHLRRSLKRKERMLQEEDKIVEFQRFNRGSVRKEHFNTIFSIGEKAIFSELYGSDELKNFYMAMERSEMVQKEIDISFLLINKIPVAFEYGFLYNNIYEAWRGSYSADYRDYSPGNLLFLNLLKENFKSGIFGVDLLRGEHDYKKRWRGSNRIYTLLWIVPRKNILACAFYIWLPALKKNIINHLKKKEQQTDADED